MLSEEAKKRIHDKLNGTQSANTEWSAEAKAGQAKFDADNAQFNRGQALGVTVDAKTAEIVNRENRREAPFGSAKITDSEKAKFFELYNTSPEKANAYAKRLTNYYQGIEAEDIQKWAGQNVGTRLVADAASLALMPFQTAAGVIETESNFVRPNDPYRETNLNSYLNPGALASNLRAGARFEGNVAGTLDDIVYTTAQSLIAQGMTGGMGSLLLSGNVLESSYRENRNAGMSSEQAMVTSAVMAGISYITEHMGTDQVFDRMSRLAPLNAGTKTVVASTVKQLLSAFLSEGIEEGAEGLLDNAAEVILDRLYGTDYSTFATKKAELIAKGLSDDEATKQAIYSIAQEIGKEMLMGGASGLLGGGAVSVASNIRRNAINNKMYNQAVENNRLGGESGLINTLRNSTDADVSAMAQNLNENSKKRDIGKAINVQMGAIERDAIATSLSNRGMETQQAQNLAEAIRADNAHEILTNEQRELLKQNKDVVKSINNDIKREAPWVQRMYATQGAFYEGFDSKTNDTVAETVTEPKAEEKPSTHILTKDELNFKKAFGLSLGANEAMPDIKSEQEVTPDELIASYAKSNDMDVKALSAGYETARGQIPNLSANRYANSLDLAYEYGRMRESLEKLTKALPIPVDENVSKRYEQGLQDSIKARSEAVVKATIRKQGYTFLNDGNARFATNEDITAAKLNYAETITDKELTDKQRAIINFWTQFYKGTKYRLLFYATELQNGSQAGVFTHINGQPVVMLDVNEPMLLRKGVHEFVHALRNDNPALYEELKQYIKDKFYQDKDIVKEAREQKAREDYANAQAQVRQGKIKTIAEYKSNLDPDSAEEEIIARHCENVFDDIEAVSEIYQRKPGLWNAIKDFFDKFLTKLKEVIAGYGRNDNKYAEELAQDIDAVERVRSILLKGRAMAINNETQQEIVENSIPVDVSTDTVQGEDTKVANMSVADEMEDLTEIDMLAPYSVEWDRGILMDGEDTPTMYSTRAGIEALGFGYDITEDNGLNMLSIKTADGKLVDKDTPVSTIRSIISRQDSPLNRLIDMSKSKGIIGEDEQEAFYNATAEFIHSALVYGQDPVSGKDKLDAIWKWAGSDVFRAIKPNSDKQYGTSNDMQTVCKKTEQVLDSISEYQVKAKRGVSPGEVMRIYLETGENGYQTPCPFCYVFSHWIRMGLLYETAASAEDHYMAKLKEKNGINDLEWWKKEYTKQKEFADKNSKAIADAKADLEDIERMIDQFARPLADAVRNNDTEAVNRIQAIVDRLNTRYIAAYKLASASDYAGWIKNCILNIPRSGLKDATAYGDYKLVNRDILFDFRRADELVRDYPALARFRTSKGSAGGKAVENYADNKFGEVIAGVATDGERDADNKLLNYFKGNGTKEEFEKQFDSARKRIAKQNLRGGQRFFSWSDNRIDTGIDMLFNFIQFSALGSAVQSYTKQIEGLELIASVGGYCNASLVGKGIGFRNAKYDENGKVISGELVFSNIQGINAETTFELNRRYDKAGNILVGMNDTHIALALGDDRIFFVIPWHRSGLSNDLLFRMMAMLGEEYVSEGKGSDSDATDYSNYQEEKSYSKHMDGTLEKYKGIPTTVTDLFKKIEGMSAQGQTARDIRGFDRVTVDNGKLSDSQIAYRKLRAKVMTGKSLTEEEKQWVIGDEYLTRLQDSMRRNEIESWGTDDIDSIYPYEYWDTNTTYANADRNGIRYLEYCRRLGVQPKFCGINNTGDVKGVADFTELPGYWKVLVDRRMYDTKGRYQGLTPISLVNKGSTQRGFLNELITPEGIKAREEEYAKMGLDYKVTRLADAVGARKIADRVRTSMGDLYNIDRASDGETALAEYKASIKDVDLNKVAPQSKFSTRGYFDTEETQTLTEDPKAGPLVNTLINTIKGAGATTFSPKAFYDFYTENPEYDFVARIQEGDGNAAFELADILAKMDSVQMVDDLKWYAVESHPLYRDLHTGKDIRNSNGDIATFAQTHRKGIREFRRLCDERIEQLKSETAHGENLGIKNMTDMPMNEVKDLFDRLNSNADIQKLADKVFGVAKDLNLAVVFSNGAFSGTNRVGYYHGNRSLTTGRNGLVALKTSLFNDRGTTNQQKATVILHEMIHAVTSSLLYTPTLKRTHFDVSVKTQNAIDALNGLYRRLIRSTATSKFKSTYGLTNTHEFVAELANSQFRDELANAQVGDINPYVESLRYIGDLVGLDGSANLRDNTLAVLDNFIDNFYEDIDTYREMAGRRMYKGNSNVPKYSIRYNEDGSVTVDGISAFSGGGTIDYMLGDMVSHIFAAEYDEQIAAVYETNNGIKAHRDILDDKTLEELKNIKESIEYAHFSPVCTNVSLANNNRGETARDIEFAHKVVEWIDAKKPLALTVENVPQYANTQSAKIIIEALKRNGYNFKQGIYNSVDFGGDMSRDRFFIRALLHGEVPEVVKTGRTTKGWYNAVKDLIPLLKQSETSKQAMNKGAVYTKNYIPAWMKERLDAMKINYKSPSKPLFIMGTGEANGLVRVYEADQPIGSVKAKVGEPKIILTNGRVLDVSPTIIARLMGIPDSFKLPNSKTRAFKILGNGVPGQLSRAMAVPLINEVIEQDRANQKFSTRDVTYEEVTKAREAFQKANDEYSALDEEFRSKSQEVIDRNKDNLYAAIPDIKRIQDEYEERLNKARAKYERTKKKYDKLDEAYWTQKTNAEKAKEKAEIEKSGLSEADYHRKLAKKEFGLSGNFKIAGYLMPNGGMLNFGAGSNELRGEDHRGISSIYPGIDGSAGMLKFIGEGNIRLMPESPGVDMSADTEPTKQQYTILKRMIEYLGTKEKYFSVDFTDTKSEYGYTVANLVYEDNINPTRIINDIKHYYATGEAKGQSVVSQFHTMYSIRTLPDGTQYVDLDEEIPTDENGNPLSDNAIYKQLVNKEIELSNGEKIKFVPAYEGRRMARELLHKYLKFDPKELSVAEVIAFNEKARHQLRETFKASSLQIANQEVREEKKEHHPDTLSFDKRAVYLFDGKNGFRLDLSVANAKTGEKVIYSRDKLHKDDAFAQKIKNLGWNKILHINQVLDNRISQNLTEVNPQTQKNSTRLGEDLTPLKTLNGSVIKRSRYGVGKDIGGQIYLHKNYATDVIPADVWEKALSIVPKDFAYNTVMYDSKKPNEVRFDEAPDFDTAREPHPGQMLKVNVTDGTATPAKGNGNMIWHHKWLWVKNDYTGFDVEESYNWSKRWLEKISNPSGSLRVWNEALEKNGLPKFSTREQEFTSEDTSLNQTPSTFTNYQFSSKDRILDWGGGRYDAAKTAMQSVYPGIAFEIVDPFNRTESHNDRIKAEFKKNPATVLTINNVLNVIKEASVRESVLRESKEYLAKDGIAYILIHPGTTEQQKAGGGETTKGWQNAKPASWYEPEVKKVYKNAKVVGQLILASDGEINYKKIDAETKAKIDVAKVEAKSQRLDMKESLYSTRTELSNYEILAETLESNLQSQADKDALKMYKASYNEALKIRARLDELNTLLREETHPAVQHNYQTQINELRKSLRKREEILDKVLTKPRIASLVAKQKADIQKLEGYLMDEQMTHQEDVEALRKRLGKLGDKIVQQNERFRAYRARMAENKGINYYRPRIEKVAKSLSEQLNTTLPIPFRQPIAGVLSLLDFTTKKDGSVRTGKANFDRQVAQAQFAKMAQDASDPYKFFSEYGIDISPDFADWVREIQQWFADATSGMTTMDVRAMDSYQLQSLYRFLKNIDTQAKKATKMYQAKATSVKDLGENTMIHLEPLAVKEQGKLQGVTDFLTWENAQPVTAFDRFGESGKKLFEAFADSQDQLAWDNKAIREFTEKLFEGKDIASWRSETQTVKIGDEEVTAPIAFWMEMYCYLNQEDSYRHLIEGGGFRMKDYKEKGKTITDTDRFMTEEDLIAIENALTQEQKSTALAMKKYMAETGSEWGNAISRVRFGIDQFGSIKDYYPIKTIRSETQEAKMKEEDGGNLYALMNKSWTKGRVMNAKNALVVGDIFETFAKHMGEMATYHSFALSTLDTIKWLNYKSNELSDDDKIREKSVQGAMKQAYGNAAPKYIFDFLDSVNGTAQAKDDTFALRFVSAKNRVAVGANFRVMIQQPLSLARAFSEISPKYFSLFNYKQTYDEMMQYGGIAEWKANGHYETNISRSLLDQIAPDKNTARAKKITDITMKGAELGDTIAWTTLWNACKNEVKEQNPQLTGEALMDKVNKRFRDIVYRTQVVDSTLTRSAYMRKKDYFHRITSSFKSEPTATLNMLVRAVDAFRYDTRRYGKAQAWARNKSVITTTLAAFALTQILNAAVTAIVDAFRDDDDYETWIEKWYQAFKGSVAENFIVLNSVPYVADLFSLLAGYTPSRPDMEVVSSLISTAKQTWSAIQRGSMTPKNIFNLVTTAAYATGLPIQNVMRDVIGFYNGTIGILYDLKITDSTSAKFQMSPETNKSGYTAFYSALKENRTERAMSLLTEMADNDLDAKKIYNGTYNLVKEDYQAGRISKEDALKYVRMIVEFTGIERTDKQINDLVDGW